MNSSVFILTLSALLLGSIINTAGELAAVSEGNCLGPPSQRKLTTWFFVSMPLLYTYNSVIYIQVYSDLRRFFYYFNCHMQIFSYFDQWYIPMGNEYVFRRYAEILLNRPAANATELSAMKLRIECKTIRCTAIGSGYVGSPELTQSCAPTVFNILNPALIDSFTCTSGANLLGLSKPVNPCSSITTNKTYTFVNSFDYFHSESQLIYSNLHQSSYLVG